MSATVNINLASEEIMKVSSLLDVACDQLHRMHKKKECVMTPFQIAVMLENIDLKLCSTSDHLVWCAKHA